MKSPTELVTVTQMGEAIAPLFKKYGWTWLNDRESPSVDRIATEITNFLNHLRKDRKAISMRGSKLLVVRDDEFPKSYEVFVSIGHIDDK